MKDFPESSHVRFLDLEDASDFSIFNTARQFDYSLVTFDSDFADLNILNGSPPKIIWIRTGNLTTKSISELLLKNLSLINEFLNSKNQEVLQIYN